MQCVIYALTVFRNLNNFKGYSTTMSLANDAKIFEKMQKKKQIQNICNDR